MPLPRPCKRCEKRFKPNSIANRHCWQCRRRAYKERGKMLNKLYAEKRKGGSEIK